MKLQCNVASTMNERDSNRAMGTHRDRKDISETENKKTKTKNHEQHVGIHRHC